MTVYTFHNSKSLLGVQRVNKEYSSKAAILGVDNIVEFEGDRITLDIPMEGAEVSGGWRITPMFHPTVGKS